MKFVLVFNHQLTQEQVEDARKNLGVTEFLYLPEELLQVWTNIPPEGPWQEQWISPLKEWLDRQMDKHDLALVQGEFGATYSLVTWLKERGNRVYYATTRRESIEEISHTGEVVSKKVFKHINFREYPPIVG